MRPATTFGTPLRQTTNSLKNKKQRYDYKKDIDTLFSTLAAILNGCAEEKEKKGEETSH